MGSLPSALITSLCATGVAAARALACYGVKVYGTDVQFAVGRFSKNIKRPFFGYKVDIDSNLLSKLIWFSERQNHKPFLLPTNDVFIEFVGKHYETLKNYYIMQKSLHPDVGKLFLDKKEFYKLCKKHNVQYPKTVFLLGNESVDEIADQMRFPLILKPHYIHKFKKRLHGEKVIYLKELQDLKEAFQIWRDYLKYMVIQEVIEGEDSDIWIFKAYSNEESEILCYFTGRKLRQYPTRFGSASLAESTPNDEVASLSIELLRKLKFKGLCGVEFKFDRRDNAYKMIEINIRPQTWDDLMRIAGKEIIWAAYCDLMRKKATPQKSQIYGVKWSYLTRDIVSAIQYVNSGTLGFTEWLKSYKGLRNDALLDKNDLKMFFGTPLYTLHQFSQFCLTGK